MSTEYEVAKRKAIEGTLFFVLLLWHSVNSYHMPKHDFRFFSADHSRSRMVLFLSFRTWIKPHLTFIMSLVNDRVYVAKTDSYDLLANIISIMLRVSVTISSHPYP